MKRLFAKFTVVALMTLSAPTMLLANGTIESEVDTLEATHAKYVFLFIGDGMAMPQITATEAYLNAIAGAEPGVDMLSFSQFPAQGLTTTYSSNAFITDSAAAGTAIACGQKTESGVIAMDASKTVELPTLAEIAHHAGMRVGIVSSVNLDHATPATFYAHNASRSNYYDINIQMANSDFDYFAGGMVRTSKTPEGELSAHDVMEQRGWDIVSTREEMEALRYSGNTVYAYNEGFAFNALDYTLDQDADDISLAEFTAKGIEILDNEAGFFMMIEAGKIDWACHANDAAASIHDTLAFDEAVQEAIVFYNDHPEDTLIIVTGDHETGGLTLGFAGTKYGSAFDTIDEQGMSFEAFDTFVLNPFKEANPNGVLADLLPQIEDAFGLNNLTDYEMGLLEQAFANSMMDSEERSANDETYLLYGGYEPLTVTITHVLNNRAGLAWTSYSHTGVPVPTFALGAGADLFNGYYDNTDIFYKTVSVMGLSVPMVLAR